MGGNTYNRKYFTDQEIAILVSKINGFKSLFDERIFDTETQWRHNISRYLDNDSCNRFYYMLEKEHFCNHCSARLTIKSYNYVGYNKGFSKYCPECTTTGVWRQNQSRQSLRERGKKISLSKKEFYSTPKGKETSKQNGKKISKSLKQFHKTEAGAKARTKSAVINSTIMRERILNGTFTPNSNNRNTHWQSTYGSKSYRSSWEALYQYFYPMALYENLRIEYSYNNKKLVYIVDFIDHTRKVVCEVKPTELLTDKKTQCKLESLRTWAADNDYTVELFTLNSILSLEEPVDFTLFDEKTAEKIRKIYETTKNSIN